MTASSPAAGRKTGRRRRRPEAEAGEEGEGKGPSWDILGLVSGEWIARIWAEDAGNAWGLANLAFPHLGEKFPGRKASAKFYMEGTVSNEREALYARR